MTTNIMLADLVGKFMINVRNGIRLSTTDKIFYHAQVMTINIHYQNLLTLKYKKDNLLDHHQTHAKVQNSF